MDVTLNPLTRQISALYTARFAEPEEKKSEVVVPSSSDQVTISQEGIETASSKVETLADKVATKLGTMKRADFMEQLKQWQSENQTPLEVDPYYSVDPDGSIATKTYFESYLGQLQEAERTIKDYYSDAYNEALSADAEPGRGNHGKFHEPDDVKINPATPKAPGRKASLPARCS